MIKVTIGIVIALVISAASLAVVSSLTLEIEKLSTSLDKANAKIAELESLTKPEYKEPLEVEAPEVNKNEFYIFTQELNADEEKIGVPVAVFTLTQITVHKGDKVTIHFINTAEEPNDRHTFTMQAPYQMNYDLAGGENATFSFTTNTSGTFTYYCKYDLPSMTGQLVVLP